MMSKPSAFNTISCSTLIFFVVATLLLFSVGCSVLDDLNADKSTSSSLEQVSETSTSNGIQEVVIQIKASCDPTKYATNPLVQKEFQNSIILVTTKTTDEISELKKDSCVIRVGSAKQQRELLQKIKPLLNGERNEKLKKLFLERTLLGKDVLDKENLTEFLEEVSQNVTVQEPVEEEPSQETPSTLPEDAPPGGVISSYQAYVTPTNSIVKQHLESQNLESKEEIYKEALYWVWVSEETLNNELELWLVPADFIADTPTYPNNPAQGMIASDCSEQANALVSLLIASGNYDETTARVVLGEVNFGGNRGGHAWAEVYEDGEWMPLEATAGNYYDDSTGQVVLVDTNEMPYTYFKYYEYPVIELWYYYNNRYFVDLEEGISNAPSTWSEISPSYTSPGSSAPKVPRRR